MKRLRLILADAAVGDIIEQSDWYAQHAGGRLSERWERAVSQAVLRVLRNAHSGSLCRFKAPELHGVRRVLIAGFPKHLMFYGATKQEVRILRIIHGARDFESLF